MQVSVVVGSVSVPTWRFVDMEGAVGSARVLFDVVYIHGLDNFGRKSRKIQTPRTLREVEVLLHVQHDPTLPSFMIAEEKTPVVV